MGLSHRFDQVLSFAFGHVTQSCSCAPAIAGVRWIRSSVQGRFSTSRLTIERLEGHACAVLTTALFPRIILLCPVEACLNLTRHRVHPKGLLQRIRAHGISESTTTHSRPKSQASHTAKSDSVLLFTQSGSLVQPAVTRFRSDSLKPHRVSCSGPFFTLKSCDLSRPRMLDRFVGLILAQHPVETPAGHPPDQS